MAKRKAKPSRMPEYRHQRRGSIAAEYATPGPAAYYNNQHYVGYDNHVPTHHRSPAYSIGLRVAAGNSGLGPGPGAYDIRDNTRGGRTYIPGGTIARRYKPSAEVRIPGPGTYSPEQCTPKVRHRAPCATMTGKSHVANPMGITPGPAAYQHTSSVGTRYPLSTKSNAPAYTIAGREAFGNPWTAADSPGPSAYAVVAVEKYMTPAAPAYTHGGRDRYDRDRRVGPGPAAYHPGLASWKRQAPAHTLGIKHSIYAGAAKEHAKDLDW